MQRKKPWYRHMKLSGGRKVFLNCPILCPHYSPNCPKETVWPVRERRRSPIGWCCKEGLQAGHSLWPHLHLQHHLKHQAGKGCARQKMASFNLVVHHKCISLNVKEHIRRSCDARPPEKYHIGNTIHPN